MMPIQDPAHPGAAEAPSPPEAQQSIAPTKLTLHDLFTGGWTRPLAGLPTALGRPLARWTATARGRAATWRVRAPHGDTQR